MLAAAWVAAALTAVPAHAQTAPAAEPRLALVIGNGAYRDQPLKNPVNDARATAAALRKLGFTVIERTDAGKTAMESAILEFGDKLRGGGVGLFYYAGHGIQSNGRNYLLPVDVAVTSEASVRVYGVEASLVMDLMSDARNRANIVILDACRNNPFVMASRGAKGLAAIDAARGTLIAYSTAPGMVAIDGEGQNSPYTTGLMKALDEPGLKVEEVFKQVRRHVADATKGGQTPWESSSLTGDLILNLNITINTPAPAVAVGGRDPADVAFWNAISASNDPQDFQDYLKQFPNGVFSGLAGRRLADLNRRTQLAEAEKQRKEAEEAEKKRLAAEAEKKRLDEIERRRLAAEEAEKRRIAAEAEKQRLAALEAERQKKAAEEAERRRLAAEEAARQKQAAAEEAEKKRLAAEEAARQKQATAAEAARQKQAAEAERQRKAAEEAEKQRLATEEAARRTQQAALPPQTPAADPRQRAYDRIMGVLLNQTAQSGTDAGRRNDYRSAPKPKAIAACLDWSAGSADGVTVGAWASSWIPPGGSGIPPKRDAMQKCERGNTVGKQCRCQIVDEDDANVLELPKNVAVASAAPPAPAQTQQAALPPQPQPASPAAGFNGTWTGGDSTWQVSLVIDGGKISGEAKCKETSAVKPASVTGAISPAGAVDASLHGNGWSTRQLTGNFPTLRLTAQGSCGGGVLAFTRTGEPPAAKGTAMASAAPAQTQQAALPPQSADPRAKWDGKWKVWLKRRREDYSGEAIIKDGHVKLRARADIYLMVGEGDIDDQGNLSIVVKFENRPDSYPLKLTFQGTEATGTWDQGHAAKFTKQ